MATNTEHFNEHTDSLIAKTRPKNIFSLIDKKAIEELSTGHLISLKTALGLVYTEDSYGSIERLQHYDAFESRCDQ